ncbi:MAG TPA: hypothetical protein VFF65_11220 [Phycisphaerales bacterium]|nr:hypothetical protein [Phycisphaerales bacterium]
MELAPPTAAAREAALRYADCRAPGIRRLRRGRGFAYVDACGSRVSDKATLDRIAALVIPPAWEDVWICADPDGHLQATGTDVRGRKQYRYHAGWSHHRNLSKFAGLADFARLLPAIRRRVSRDMGLPGMPRDKVLACVVHLLDAAHIRIGNDEYARSNNSYGLTTMRNEHAKVRGDEVRFCFRAKSGKQCEARVHDPAAARIVRRCQDLPGQELFTYIDEAGAARDVSSGDVNDYLASACGARITAKDFRTWGGTIVAARTLLAMEPAAPDARAPTLKRRELAAVRAAAAALCNTVATSRKYYVHPEVISADRDGRLRAAVDSAGRSPRELRQVERAVAALLRSAVKARRAA